MTAFLLDTNVVSELVRPAPNPGVLRFLSNEGDFWLSVITLHELAYGAALIRDSVRRTRIEGWIEAIKSRFAGRLIAIDGPIAEWAGRARAAAAANGRVITPLELAYRRNRPDPSAHGRNEKHAGFRAARGGGGQPMDGVTLVARTPPPRRGSERRSTPGRASARPRPRPCPFAPRSPRPGRARPSPR